MARTERPSTFPSPYPMHSYTIPPKANTNTAWQTSGNAPFVQKTATSGQEVLQNTSQTEPHFLAPGPVGPKFVPETYQHSPPVERNFDRGALELEIQSLEDLATQFQDHQTSLISTLYHTGLTEDQRNELQATAEHIKWLRDESSIWRSMLDAIPTSAPVHVVTATAFHENTPPTQPIPPSQAIFPLTNAVPLQMVLPAVQTLPTAWDMARRIQELMNFGQAPLPCRKILISLSSCVNRHHMAEALHPDQLMQLPLALAWMARVDAPNASALGLCTLLHFADHNEVVPDCIADTLLHAIGQLKHWPADMKDVGDILNRLRQQPDQRFYAAVNALLDRLLCPMQ